MLRKLYDRVIELATHRTAPAWLAVISFLESSFFPVPPDVLLVPMAVSARRRAFRFALICTVASVAGALLGYAIGFLFWESLGQPVIAFYGYEEEFARFSEGFLEYGALIVFFFGITFFPYKVITIASGVVALDLFVFIAASITARGLRFFIEAAILWKWGEAAQRFVEDRLALVVSAATILLVAGFIAIKYL